ncbi:MAG: hypothetical protein WCV80_00480 [Candidatus Paceibacterota bacterium]|jgi:hypothetical protein
MKLFSRKTHEEFIRGKMRPRQKRQLWLLIGGGTLFVLLCVGCYYLLFLSTVFKVKEFSVEGNRFMQKEVLHKELVQKIDNQGWFVRMLGEDNVWYWRLGRTITQNDSSIIPAASQINIAVNVWNHAVKVEVTERVLAGVWCTDTCFGFDETGILFSSAPNLSGSLILKIKDENIRALIVGAPVLSDVQNIKNILETVRVIKESGLPISEVRIKEAVLGEWEVKSLGGSLFHFSLNFVPENLAGTLKTMRERTQFENLTYLDFRIPNRVYYQ